ncbi:hypothetical protein EPUS_07641 [Endocarpon pusillum Z07020]|uniref:Zn(2)-C6 fungal-type domain-containing protein n=1 Tax=Endocarpon pusillum (strain Z07020 / HMAS-L-300199) TaxID=1263415 RepID=U1GXJ8_ENDPU|nr:uncharacterized protein EPUS_07641 [Endocarpon pusillum Z07020]ERF76851.1 hypothetical protein EPUS_07641 [Endocarpon pusillum Z07020]
MCDSGPLTRPTGLGISPTLDPTPACDIGPSINLPTVAGAGSGAGGGGSGHTSRPSVNSRPPTTESRKRNSLIAGLDNSPGSVDSAEFDGTESGQQQEEERRHPIKRACNECRQQKLRCDVVQDPFTICSRCRRLNLSCKVQENFKRVGKRSRNAEMEREIVKLRKQLAEQSTPTTINGLTTPNATQAATYASEDQYGANEAAVEGLMVLSGGLNTLKRIEDVLVPQDCVAELFNTQVFHRVVDVDS